MERDELIRALASAAKQTALRFHEYDRIPHEYLEGHTVYMREADFLELVGDSGISIGQAAQKLRVTHSAASQIATRLEEKGYITKQRTKGDRRVGHVTCTALGQAIRAAHANYEERIYQQMAFAFADLDAETLSRLIRFEKEIADIMEQAR